MDALDIPVTETFEARVEAAQAELRVSIDRGGLRDDPYRYPLQALSDTMGLFPGLLREMRAAVDAVRQPIDPGAVERIEAAAVLGADRRAGQLMRAHNLRTILIAAAVLGMSTAAAATAGYFAGRQSELAVTSAAGAAVGRDGPDAAATWLRLIQSNDGRQVARICAETTAKSDGGRQACALGLWIEPPPNVAPRTAPAPK